jgi:hypothetical protein
MGVGAQILGHLDVTSIRLRTNNPRTYVGLSGFGIEIASVEPIEGRTIPASGSGAIPSLANHCASPPVGHRLDLPDRFRSQLSRPAALQRRVLSRLSRAQDRIEANSAIVRSRRRRASNRPAALPKSAADTNIPNATLPRCQNIQSRQNHVCQNHTPAIIIPAIPKYAPVPHAQPE